MDKLYTINEVAAKLNLSDKTLRRWEEAGRFTPSRTLGNQRRYSLDDIQILDALKHNVISEQKELLNAAQAASLCGVSPATIARWEDEGKIHPFITSGYTFYPKSRLLAKLAELKASMHIESPEETREMPPGVQLPGRPTPPTVAPTLQPQLAPLPEILPQSNPLLTHKSYFLNLLTSLFLILFYHLLFNTAPTPPLNPQGTVQGISTTSFDPRVDDLLTKFQTYLDNELLQSSSVATTQTIRLDNTSLISGVAQLRKGESQVSVTHATLTPDSLVTATFSSDFSPAKKYWITPLQGSFTLTTDFPLGQDAIFHYQFLTPTATQSAL